MNGRWAERLLWKTRIRTDTNNPLPTYVYVTWWKWQNHTACIGESNKWTRILDIAQTGLTATTQGSVWSPGFTTFRNYETYFATGIGQKTNYTTQTCGGDNTWVRMEQIVDARAGLAAVKSDVRVNNIRLGNSPYTIPFPFERPPTSVRCVGFDGSNVATDLQPIIDFGEVYIDDTPARVEICNNATKSLATHCEIQIPQNVWKSDGTEIQVKINQGSFSNGATAYLFVIDSAEAVSPTGRAVTFDGTVPVVNGLCDDESAVVNVCPSSDLCVTGTPSAVTQNSTTCTWSCVGTGGGTTDSCSAPFSESSGDPAVFAFSASTYSVNEGETAVLRVNRTVNTDGPGSIYYRTDGVTASGTEDYWGANGETLLFADGETYKDIEIITWGDDLETEGTETTVVTITASSGELGTPVSATLSILDAAEPILPSAFRSDVDNNQETNTTDALLTLRNSLELDMTSTAWQEEIGTGDANCDDVSNSTDALLILRYSIGSNMEGTEWCGE